MRIVEFDINDIPMYGIVEHPRDYEGWESPEVGDRVVGIFEDEGYWCRVAKVRPAKTKNAYVVELEIVEWRPRPLVKVMGGNETITRGADV